MRDVRWAVNQAIGAYGEESQLNQLAEEASEMAVAVNHLRRKKPGALDELIGEAADLEIMLEQVRIMYGDEPVDAAKEFKLDRLLSRIRAGDHGDVE